MHRLREAIETYEENSIHLLDGEVEVDETYCGARLANRKHIDRQRLRKAGQVKRGRGAKHLKHPVFGIYERSDGIVYVQLVGDVSKKTLHDIIKGKLRLETVIYSDTWKGYNQLDQTFKGHYRVDHSQQEYVRGSASINGIEGFWGYLKEQLLKYHGLRSQNFRLYLKEAEYRFNHRHLTSEEFVYSLGQVLMQIITP